MSVDAQTVCFIVLIIIVVAIWFILGHYYCDDKNKCPSHHSLDTYWQFQKDHCTTVVSMPEDDDEGYASLED